MADADKIMGFVPKDRYMYFTYMFVLVSAAGNAFFALLGMIGLGMASAGYGLMIVGLFGLILAVVGLTQHKNDFTATEHAHFKYLAVLFVGFFIVNVVFGGVYMIAYTLGYLCTIALGVIETILVWTGWNALQGGRVITKDNLQSEVKVALAKR